MGSLAHRASTHWSFYAATERPALSSSTAPTRCVLNSRRVCAHEERGTPARVGCLTASPWSCATSEQQAPAQVGSPAGQAVSYTHLRAHETVLDLVCRLLLEK